MCPVAVACSVIHVTELEPVTSLCQHRDACVVTDAVQRVSQTVQMQDILYWTGNVRLNRTEFRLFRKLENLLIQ
jgi:hypothetical protein